MRYLLKLRTHLLLLLIFTTSVNCNAISSQNEINQFLYNYLFPIDTIVVNRLFMPVVFTGKVLPDTALQIKSYQNPELSKIDKFIPSYMKPDTNDIFRQEKLREEFNRKVYLDYVYNHPASVKYALSTLPKKSDVTEHLSVNTFKDLFNVEVTTPDISVFSPPDKFTFRKYWLVHGNNLLQFSQNYISDNWSSGGVGNLNILSKQNMTVSYSKNKVNFSSYWEWNTSLYTNPNDSLRKTKIGTDLLRSYSDFGIQTFNKRWFYSTNIELKTQIFNNYKENTRTLISSFMAPFFVNMGILGMKYELDKQYKSDKYKRLKITTDISPLSVKYVYVANDKVDPTRYGIPAGKNHLLDLGSTINSTLSFNITRSTSLKSRFKYFTSYSSVEIESENELNVAISRYFSTRIYLYVRFDDGEKVPYDPTFGYFQINQLLSFGFNYKW